MKCLTQIVSFYEKIKHNKWAYMVLCLLVLWVSFGVGKMLF